MVGKCNIQQPGLFDVKKKAKYEAWKRKETMSKVEAMNGYIKCTTKIITELGRELEFFRLCRKEIFSFKKNKIIYLSHN